MSLINGARATTVAWRSKSHERAQLPGTSVVGGEADEIGAKADIGARRSAVGGRADVPATWPGSLLLMGWTAPHGI